ncbi:S9 family peptidase [Paraliomyxa miuraensis]|uniref:S9 family peptidase n=1 Tax=Paraliomyxa miuraensis TaxID=376150 RepID=UPI0022558CB5|nr:S9 family peptidase [Paraliomyxa miuraensis]MCX4241175.1 S9 family peptidase [Paraliomyxa miuraensis]
MRRLSTFALTFLLLGCAKPALARAGTSAPAASVPSVPRTDVLTVEAMVDLEYVADVALSPDGKTVAYVLRVPPDAMDGPAGMRSAIWVVPTKPSGAAGKGHGGRSFTTPSASSSSPRWSPDGKRIGFLSRRPGTSHTQVYAVPIDGGEAEPLTNAPANVHEFEWSPDGKRLAFIADQQPTAKESDDRKAGRDWVESDVQGTMHRLWVMDLRTEEAQPISPRGLHVSHLAWSPDSKRLALQASERADVDATMMYSRLYTIDVKGDAKGDTAQPQPLCETAGKLSHMAWSPDGSQLAFLGAADLHDPTAGVLHVVSTAGGTPGARARALTMDYEGTGQWIDWVAKDTVLMLANEGTRTTLHRVGTDGARKALGDTGPVCFSFDANASGSVAACAGERADHPRELYAGPLPLGGGKLRRVTHHNPGLDAVRLGDRSIARWKAADGVEIEGVLTKPVGYEAGKRYPLALLVHGGPEGISLDGWNTRSGYPTQLLATRGYVVLEPNYRGSSGRGVAFGKSDQGDLGGKEFEDVLAGIDHLVAEGLVDPERVGMAGWSYGGYFSGLAATKHSKRFRAAVVSAAITNWISFTGTSEIEHENSLVHWTLWPYDEPTLAWERSPMAHTTGSTTATLVVHGMDDTRVPPEQAKELYRALRHAGTKTEIVLYPREGHGLRERAHQIDFAARLCEWLDEHVKG